MRSVWITWELFEELYGFPARSFPERCNFKNCIIYIKGIK